MFLCIKSYNKILIYVIDNRSTDKTLSILDSYDDERIQVIRNDNNIGVAKANNQGIKLALEQGCSQILIINNDTEFEESLIEKMLVVQDQEQCSLVVPRIMYFDKPDIIWYGGGKFVKNKGFLPEHIGYYQKYKKESDIRKQVQYAPTCCVLIKKKVFEDVGFMDERYFVYFDDTDFMYRVLQHREHKLFYFSKVIFYHKVGSLTKSFEESKKLKKYRGDFFIKQNIRNHIYFLKKIGTLYCYLFIIFLFFRNNLRFFINHYFRKNFNTC